MCKGFLFTFTLMAHRILIVTNRTPYPFNDGGNMAMRAMIEGYYEAGWEVYLLAMNTKRHPVPDDVLKKAYAHIQHVSSVPVDNEIRLLPTLSNYFFSSKPNHAARFYHSEFADRLTDVLKTFKPEVVQLESLYLATYLPQIKRYSNAKTILRSHNVEHEVWDRLAKETKNPLKKIYLNNLAKRIRNFEHEVWGKFDLLLPITEEDAKAIQEEHVDVQMIVVPFAVDDTTTAIDTTAKWNLYHIGAMDWLPNAEAIKWFLEDVWPYVHETHKDCKFYFAGRNMPTSFKQSSIDGTICEGEVEDAATFIADKKILVVPLRSGGGIRVKILEAMAAGKIVISTHIGMQGIPAIPGKHFLQADTAAAFIEQINWCLNNKAQAENLGIQASAFVTEHYSGKKIMEGFVKRVEEMLLKQ